MNEKRINQIDVAPDAKITKGMSHFGRQQFMLPVIYTLEDGQTIPCRVCADRKKDIEGKLARERENAQNGSMKATFDADGRYTGTVTRWVLGGSGLVPVTA